MRFTVSLALPAEQQLAAAWLASPDREAVTIAAFQMEQKLAALAPTAGESRQSTVTRVDWIPPLGFMFDVIVDDATVFVTAIWLIE
jgi:hypothetical protein